MELKTRCKIYFYLTISFGLFVVFSMASQCDETVMRELLSEMEINENKFLVQMHKYGNVYQRLTGPDFCHEGVKCPSLSMPEAEEEGNVQQLLPTSCAEALEKNYKDGVRKLQMPYEGAQPFYAFCMHDKQDNGERAWTVLLRRANSNFDFNRIVNAYRLGFGDVLSEYWIGLTNIHEMTYFQPHELWIHLRNKFKRADVRYSLFAINSWEHDFEFNVLGKHFSDDLSDDLRYNVGNRFSAKDHDLSHKKCSQTRGGWWFSESPSNRSDACGEVYLTGNSGAQNNTLFGIHYNYFNEQFGKIEHAIMAIRPVVKKK